MSIWNFAPDETDFTAETLGHAEVSNLYLGLSRQSEYDGVKNASRRHARGMLASDFFLSSVRV